MKFEFKITFDVNTGEYKSDAETIYESGEKEKIVNLADISDKVSAMFVKLSKDYSKKILRNSLEKFTKKNKESMN